MQSIYAHIVDSPTPAELNRSSYLRVKTFLRFQYKDYLIMRRTLVLFYTIRNLFELAFRRILDLPHLRDERISSW